MGWSQRLGLQKRIMLYVAIGLVVMFGAFIYLGMQAIAQATELVYEERVGIAHMTAGILERDFGHVTRDVAAYAPSLATAGTDARGHAVVQELLHHLSSTDRPPFFQVNGVWMIDSRGAPLIRASTEALSADAARALSTRIPDPLLQGELQVAPAMVRRRDGMEFATIVVPLADASGDVRRVVAVHSASLNSRSPYVPLGSSPEGLGQAGAHGDATGGQANYNLEVVGPGGDIILGIGEDKRPGERSHHFEIIEALASSVRERIALLGGHLEIDSAPGRGTRIRVEVPVG